MLESKVIDHTEFVNASDLATKYIQIQTDLVEKHMREIQSELRYIEWKIH